jgi:hypothetical protein
VRKRVAASRQKGVLDFQVGKHLLQRVGVKGLEPKTAVAEPRRARHETATPALIVFEIWIGKTPDTVYAHGCFVIRKSAVRAQPAVAASPSVLILLAE